MASSRLRGPRIGVNPGGLGAEITGLNLAEPLTESEVRAVREAFAVHGLVWFPQQPLSQPQYLAAATALFGRPRGASGDTGPSILEIRRDADEAVVPFGAGWHSDGSFKDAPDVATLLHAKVVPPEGGDTLFVDCRDAYDALPAGLQRRLDGLIGLHSSAAYFGRDGYFAKEQGRTGMRPRVSAEAERVVRHPVVRLHAPSGRKTLYVNPGFTVGIEGLAADEAQTLLRTMFDHLIEERFVHAHRWAPDMLVAWDNRCMLHSATDGYRGHQRVMHRIITADDVPS